MKSPVTGKEMTLQREKRTITYRKEEFVIFYHFYLCADSGAQFTDDQLDELNLTQVHNQYREKYNLPFPDEIQLIREQYGLTATKMAAVLGFGTNIYRQYEQGEVPSASNGRLIRMCEDPIQFKSLVEMSNALEGNALSKCLAHIDLLIEWKLKDPFPNMENTLMGPEIPDSYSGYRRPSLEKAANMIAFFSERLQPWKTKLNKLLFYADFLHFKRYGFSISGMRYDAIMMGPVPHNFNSIFEFLSERQVVEIEYTEFENGGIGEKFSSGFQIKTEAFSRSEWACLQEVADTFANRSTKEMIGISHNEKAWAETQANGWRKISFLHFGFDLSI